MTDPVPVFDGHNDIVLKIAAAGAGREALWLRGESAGHLDLPRMQSSGFAGGFFAVWVPSPETGDLAALERLMDAPPYDLPLPDLIDHCAAQPVAVEMLGHLLWMERAAAGRFRWCRTAGEVRSAMAEGVVAGVIHFEGAEPIEPDLDALHLFHSIGLRSLGPVWSRPTVFGHGVPFRFPSTGDIGPGLTDAGKALVRECNALKIVLDLSRVPRRGEAVGCPVGGDPFQCPCRLPFQPQPDGLAAARDRGIGRDRRPESCDLLSAAGRARKPGDDA